MPANGFSLMAGHGTFGPASSRVRHRQLHTEQRVLRRLPEQLACARSRLQQQYGIAFNRPERPVMNKVRTWSSSVCRYRKMLTRQSCGSSRTPSTLLNWKSIFMAP